MSRTVNRGFVGAVAGALLFWIALAVFVGLALTGCGGGAGESPAPSPAPAATCTPHVVTIGLYGDSTQYGITRDTPTGEPYRVTGDPGTLIQAAMDARFGAGAVVVTNHGVSGQDTAQLLAGMQTFGAPWPSGAVEDLALENLGINDISHGRSADDYAANLAQIVNARAVIIETPLPDRNGASYAAQARAVATAAGSPLIDVNAYVSSLPAWSQYTGDGTHPTQAGYNLVENNAVIPALVPMVAALQCGVH